MKSTWWIFEDTYLLHHCRLLWHSLSQFGKEQKPKYVKRKFLWNSRATLACQLSCNSCSRLIKQGKLMKLSCNSPCKLSLVNSHATLVLVWSSTESWWNSHVNSRFSTLMQLLFSTAQSVFQLPKIDKENFSTFRPEGLRQESCAVVISRRCHAAPWLYWITLVLVWSSNESWWNSHVNSRFSTLMQLMFSFHQANESWRNSRLSALSSNFVDLFYRLHPRIMTKNLTPAMKSKFFILEHSRTPSKDWFNVPQILITKQIM